MQAHGGNVGIGTTAPYYKLDVAGDARIQGPNKQYFGGTTGAGTDYFYSPSSGIIQTASQLKSTVATGTAPLTVASTTKVNKLNVANSDSLGLKPAAWYRALNNHDSLSALDEKSYNSLTDKPTAWAISAITDLQDTLDRHTDTAQSHNARINSLKTATIDSLINHNTRISNVTDTTQHHNTKILAIYDSLSHIYTESQIAALLLAKLNISDTANLATITEVNSRDTLTRTTLRSQFVNRDSLAKQGIRVEYVNHDSLDRTVLRGQFNNRDSLAKRGVRTEYINHDSLVKSSLRTEYKNHDSVAKQTIRTEYVNHDTIVKTSLRVEIKNHDSVGKQGIRVEYINHDTLDRTVLRGQFINRDSLAKQGIRIEYVNHDSLDRTVLRGQFVNRDSLDRTTLRSQFNNRDTLVRIYARDRDALRVPKTTTLTINGTGYDLSTNRSWTIADNNTTYSAGYRTQLSGITFNNTSHWQDQDSLNVSDGLVLATSKKLSVITNNSADWNEAHGWGNHASAGYLTSEVDGSTTNELQGISYVNRKLTISAGGGTPNTISLPRFSTTDTASGLVKGSANVGSTYFLNGAGNWAVPPDNNTTYDLSSYVQKGDTGIIAGNFATPFDLTHGLDGKAGVNQTMYLGTTGVAINRGSGSLSLAGVSIDGTSGGLAAQYIDWNSASGGNSIKNKPTIPAAEAYFGTVTSIATTSPLTGGTITSSGTIAIIADTLVQWRTKQNKGVVAYNWGNHADAGYLTSQTSHADVVVDGDFASNGLMKRTGAGTYGIVTDNSANWNKAYDSTSSPGWISKYKIDAAGDLIIGAGNNTYNRLAIGQDRKFARSNGTTVLWDTISDADATHRGLLTSTSYNLFYNKVSFPGFGTSHSTAAYGDHTHASSMTWPASAGIPLYSGSSSWGTSIPDSSDAWTTAYKWGNHAGAGYSVISATENITGEKTFTDGKLVMGGTKATILKSSASATNKTITFPNASGTVALTIDIPSLSNYVTLDGDQTISGAKSFNDNKLQINNPAGNGTTVFGTIAHSGTSKTITFPDASGTIALTSDIPTFSTAISGYVPHFTSATNIDTTRIFISGKNIGIGTTNPTVDLQLVSNTTLLEELDVYSNTATSKGGVFFRKAKGTIASPLSVSAGDQLGVLGFVGAYSVGGVGTFPTSAQGAIFAKAEENFTSATNLGTYLTFETTSSGSGTRTEKIRINGDGTIKIGATGSSYSLPSTNGNDDQVMISNGSDGTLTWSDVGDLIAPVIEPKFALGIDSTAINTIVKYPMGYSSGIVVDSIICIGTGTGTHTSGHAEAEIYYGSDMSATGTILNNGIYFCPNYDYNKADRYSGADLHNTTIAKGNIIWVKFHSVTTSPRMIYFQIIGHAISGVPAL
ncbi:MAG: hypothetical protein M0P47_09535 [Bacteroidales bacterium]|nr:hypothetical protein [Bacteroidales bacterium]